MGPFWPSTERVPTRVATVTPTGKLTERDVTGVPSYFSWVDGGIEISTAPFSKYMNWVDTLTELPTGVVVFGSRYYPEGAPTREERLGVLVDKTGSRVLGTFRRRSTGDVGTVNAYTEGQYFLYESSRLLGSDERYHARVDIEPYDFVPVE